MGDGCTLHAAQLRSDRASVPAPGFDPRRTPQEWLEQSAGEPPEHTALQLRRLFADEASALAAHNAGEIGRAHV